MRIPHSARFLGLADVEMPELGYSGQRHLTSEQEGALVCFQGGPPEDSPIHGHLTGAASHVEGTGSQCPEAAERNLSPYVRGEGSAWALQTRGRTGLQFSSVQSPRRVRLCDP